VTTRATTTDKLHELDEGTRRAWKTYYDTLQSLTGEAYERAELECWSALQHELRRLEGNRRRLTRASG
jgi:hypothetical protein